MKCVAVGRRAFERHAGRQPGAVEAGLRRYEQWLHHDMLLNREHGKVSKTDVGNVSKRQFVKSSSVVGKVSKRKIDKISASWQSVKTDVGKVSKQLRIMAKCQKNKNQLKLSQIRLY